MPPQASGGSGGMGEGMQATCWAPASVLSNLRDLSALDSTKPIPPHTHHSQRRGGGGGMFLCPDCVEVGRPSR